MAKGASIWLFLFLLSAALTVCSTEMSQVKEIKQKELKWEEDQKLRFHRRELVRNFQFKKITHDLIDPPTTTYPTTPSSYPLSPPDTSTPTIVTVPATYPGTLTPTNPVTTPVTPTNPVTIPSTTPLSTPSPIPVTPTVPVTTPVPVPGAQPITNPVTTYPSPPGSILTPTNPVTTPVTTPVTPPSTTNSPVIPGQTWCVAKTGVPETALQAALDYACGIGGADCSAIQQGASCFNPSTLQNHASYAFNSYYQKNPAPTSCDFGGTAMLINSNPSTGSCIYPSSASSSTSLPSTAIPSSTPTTPTPPTTSSSGTMTGSIPPPVLNTSNPGSATSTVFGSDSPPPGFNTSTSLSTSLQPFVGCIFLATSFITGNILLDL